MCIGFMLWNAADRLSVSALKNNWKSTRSTSARRPDLVATPNPCNSLYTSPNASATGLLSASGKDGVFTWEFYQSDAYRNRYEIVHLPDHQPSYARSCKGAVCSDVRSVSWRCHYEARIRHQSPRGQIRFSTEIVPSTRFRTFVREAMGNLWSYIVNNSNSWCNSWTRGACRQNIHSDKAHAALRFVFCLWAETARTNLEIRGD